MADGIKFLIDLDSRTRGATDAIRGLGGVESAAGKANEQIRQMDHGGKGLSQDVFKAEFAVHALEHAWEGAKRVAEKVYELVKDTIKEVAGEERSRMAFTNLLGSGGAASEEIKFLEKFSQLTEFSEDQTKAFGISLMKAGYKGQEFRNSLEAVADAASLSSNAVEGAQEAMSALTRMKLTGKLDARSLKGLGLDARDVTKDLGLILGMDEKSIKKGLEAGTIPAAQAFEAVLRGLERKTGKGLGESGLSAGKTLSAKLTHLAELPNRIMMQMEGSPAMERLKERFDKMLSGLDPDSPQGQKIVGGLGKLMDAIANVDFGDFIDGLAKLPATLATAIGPISEMAQGMLKLTNAVLSLPGRGEKIGDQIAQQEHDDLQAQERFKLAEFNRKHSTHAELLHTNPVAPGYGVLDEPKVGEAVAPPVAPGWKGAPWAIQPMTAGVPLPDISKAKTVTVSAPVTNHNTIHTVVQVTQPNATKEEIGEAVGRHSAKEIEKLSLKNGGRPAISAPAQGGQ